MWSSKGDNRCRVSAARRLDRREFVQIGRLNCDENFIGTKNKKERCLYSETVDI